jgi:hypothetical protein
MISMILLLPGCMKVNVKHVSSDIPDSGAAGINEDMTGDPQEGRADNEGDDGAEDAGQTSGDGIEATSSAGKIQEGDAQGTPASGGTYRLKEPQFVELGNIQLCRTAKDYIDLSDEEFSERYTDEKLWEQGAFDRLLFTENSKGKIIGDIGIGSTLQQVLDTFGDCQFGTADIVDKSAADYKRYLLYGYKTRNFYFAFRIDPGTQRVDSICLRKRYPLPDGKKDMLVELSEFGDWYGGEYIAENDKAEEWENFLKDGMIKQTQWGRGSMTLICDYGFTSTAGTGLYYGVYADYTGDIPAIPERQSEWDDSTYEPVTVFEYDYPEWLIYRIYNYLAEQEEAIKNNYGMLSPDGGIFAYALEGDWLDMRSSMLYE